MRLPLPGLGRDLGQPDGGFDRFDLAEERADAAELVMSPVLKQPRGFRRDLPLIGIGQGAPCIHMAAHFVDDRGGVVLLLLGRKTLAFVEDELLLLRARLALLRLWDRRDELRTAARFDDLLRRLPSVIKLPMPRRVLVGRVQDWMIEEGVRHNRRLLAGSSRSSVTGRRRPGRSLSPIGGRNPCEVYSSSGP